LPGIHQLAAEAVAEGGREVILRPAVQRFAEEMEKRLAVHDDDRGADGWKGEDTWWLLDRAKEELTELERSMGHSPSPRKYREVIREAADVANFCMMIADEAREFVADPSTP
jgi:hypothetical protein